MFLAQLFFPISNRLSILWFLAFFHVTRKSQILTTQATFVPVVQCRDPDLGGQNIPMSDVRTFLTVVV